MEMPGRQYNATYAYSFNGKRDDKDAEYGWQDYGMREYDRRRAQFISVDPISKKYPGLTPYQFASNSPIGATDIDGLEGLAGPPPGSIYAANKDLYDDLIAGRNTPRVQNSAKAGRVIVFAGALALDALFTKGWATRTLIAAEVIGAFPHNSATTLRGRTLQNQSSKESLTDAFLTWGTGKIIGTGTDLLISNSAFSYNFSSKALGEMGEDAMSREYGTIKPVGKGSSLRTSIGRRQPDGIPIGTTVATTDKLFESKVGFQNLSGDIVNQVAKDQEIISLGQVKQITWVFWRSPNTRKIGASDELLKALHDAGIKTELAGDLPKDIIVNTIKKYAPTSK